MSLFVNPRTQTQAAHIVDKRAATLSYWSAHGARLLRSGVTLEALRAALVTVRGRQQQLQPASRKLHDPCTIC